MKSCGFSLSQLGIVEQCMGQEESAIDGKCRMTCCEIRQSMYFTTFERPKGGTLILNIKA